MSESEQSARPRQLTMAGGFVIAGSFILLLTVFDAITNLHSVDTRDEVAKMLSSQTGEGLGITLSEALSGLRAALIVTGTGAAVSIVLGIFVLQRHRGARIALSVVAVPLLVANLVAAPVTGGLLGALIAAATLVLWTGPAGDWFAGRPVREPAAPLRRTPDEPDRLSTPPTGGPPAPQWPQPGPQDGPSAADVSTGQPSGAPPATTGFGQQPVQQHAVLPPQSWDPPVRAQGDWRQPGEGVPVGVKVACILTWTFSGVVALLYAALLVALVVAKDEIVDYVVKSPEWQRANLESNVIMPVLWLGCLMFLAWSGGALVLAWFTWRRHNWARYLLAASAGAALVAALFAFPVGLPHQIACAVAIAGLFNVRSRAWFARPTQGYWPPQGPPSGPPQSYGPPPPSAPPPGQQGKPPVW